MKRSTRIVLGVISVLAVAVCAVCIFFIVQFYRGKALSDRLGSGVSSGIISTALTDPNDPTRYMTSSVDFDELQAMNDEVYAWIEVPGTVINYAVVQSATDDLFYINHAVDKSYFSGGSIFSQRYNTTTFQDSMTVLYGHNSRSQAMFAQLNNFADASFFEQNQSIYIYTPEKVYEYTPMGKVMVTVMLAFAEYERDMIVERTSMGKAMKREHDPNWREGRKSKEIDNEQFEKLAQKQKDGIITVADCCRELGISRSTWYDRVRKVGV